MEKQKLSLEEKEDDYGNTDNENGILEADFDYSEVQKNITTSLVFSNSDISIYHAYSNQKQYTIVAYISNIIISPPTHNIQKVSRSKIKSHQSKISQKCSQEDQSLNVIQSFYEKLLSLQTQSSDYSKNVMQILHIKRDLLSSVNSYLSSEIQANVINNQTSQTAFKQNTKQVEDEEDIIEESKTSYGRQQSLFDNQEIESIKQNKKKGAVAEDRDVLLIFFESYERSIEEDIAERSLNQNNILYEDHILESYSDMIDCFQLLGNKLMQHITVNSDYLVICREKLTKILPIYDKNSMNISQVQCFNFNKLNQAYDPKSFLNSKNKSIVSTNNYCSSDSSPYAKQNEHCRTRSKTKQLLQIQCSQQVSNSQSKASNKIIQQTKNQSQRIMTRSASATLKQQIKQDQRKEIDSYTSSTIEVEMVDSNCENEEKEFDEIEEINHIDIIQKRGKQQNQKEKAKFNNGSNESLKKLQKEDEEIQQLLSQNDEIIQQNINGDLEQNDDEDEEDYDSDNHQQDGLEEEENNSQNLINQSEIDEEQAIQKYSYTKSDISSQKMLTRMRLGQNKILEAQNQMNSFQKQDRQNIFMIKELSKHNDLTGEINASQNDLLQVEKKVMEELSIIYLRLSAFLTSVKFNPQKKNKEQRIMQIIKSLIEYKISSLFTDIFFNSCLSMNFNLTYSSLKEMVNQYRMQKVIVEISENTDLSSIISQLREKTDIAISYKDKSLVKLEELETSLCQNLFCNPQTCQQKSLDDINYNRRNIDYNCNNKKEKSKQDKEGYGLNQKLEDSEAMEIEVEEEEATATQYNYANYPSFSFLLGNEWYTQITSFEFKADLCRLGDEGTLMISNILERIPPLQLKHLILSLRRNSISEQGIYGISKYVEKCKYLQTFRIFFSYNRIRDAGLASILRSIATLDQLQVLDLRFFDNQITAEGCKGFQDLQDVNFKDIKYLNMSLGNNQIGDEGCRLLSLFLCNIRNVKQLSIFLESNQINSAGIAHLKNVFLRKNQIKYLILHALSNKIEDDGIIKILENIAKLTTLQSLEIILNENSLTEKAGIALGKTIENMVNLTSLILSVRNNKISNKGVNSIGNNLKNLKNLESLVLSLTNNNIQGDGGVLIGKNLKYLTRLQKLHLVFYENQINHKSGKAIGEGLSNLKDLNYLILGIGDNNVGDEGAVAIGNCMLNLTKVKIFEIYLQNNEVGSNGASAIAKGLSNMRNLKCLVFQIQHSELGDQPMIELGRSLQNLKQLKSLDIYVERCNIGEEGGYSLGKGLYHLQNLKVMVLDLDSNGIGPRGGKALGEAFANMHGLIDLKLYLKKNNMMPEGGQGLFEGIQHLKKLKSLNIDLYKNYTGDNSIITCGRALTFLKELRNLELSITYNVITQVGAQQFSEYFGQCTSLHEVYLYMQKNNITPQGAEYIGNALSCIKDLQQLKISFGNNRIENQGISNLIKGVSACEQLRVLYLYAYNIGMTGEGCIQIAQYLKKMKKLERFEFFPSANNQINLRNGLAQIAQTVIENHETLQNVRVDIPYWDEKIKTFIKPRTNNQIQTMQTILFNRYISNYMIYNPKAIHWDFFID
ncbi:hypothetical protein TTHERM_00001340 (macronuclear) [Tetrahymena thermophila SB210]|uniref:Kinase domain protein n=1 Tax=Tetrahymena thermophila (strain SB210) TaxID=312017 RepID=Q22SK3_TETTS|nr:hypothetical protein TTHERM_00001340 [Tetrahymena thermophila SB210]EAR87769.1 hypothetical protein TTHERM_00001340 [Tetrahymena thermophila SB210]|eukprot:XP_001008014.1 hypothetical protein TTHERM_00001340 [Tetrahymena thermophila SB210]